MISAHAKEKNISRYVTRVYHTPDNSMSARVRHRYVAQSVVSVSLLFERHAVTEWRRFAYLTPVAQPHLSVSVHSIDFTCCSKAPAREFTRAHLRSIDVYRQKHTVTRYIVQKFDAKAPRAGSRAPSATGFALTSTE